VRAALIHSPDHPLTFSYIAGVGGTDVTPGVIKKIANDLMKKAAPSDAPVWVGEDLHE
jgi:hypothetical protein